MVVSKQTQCGFIQANWPHKLGCLEGKEIKSDCQPIREHLLVYVQLLVQK